MAAGDTTVGSTPRNAEEPKKSLETRKGKAENRVYFFGELLLKFLSLLKIKKSLMHRLRHKDPGLLRLKMAVNTLLGMTVSYFAFKDISLKMSVSAIFSAWALTRASDGNTLKERKTTMLIASGAMIFCIGLGGITAGFPRIDIAITAVLAFFAYYVRRFGKRYFGFPLYAFIGYLIASLSPGSWYLSIDRVVGVIGALPIIYIINFHIFPRKHLTSVISNLNQTFFQIEALLIDCRVQFSLKKDRSLFMKDLDEPLNSLREGLRLSRNLLDDHVGEITPVHKKYQRLFLIQGDIVKSLALLIRMLKSWKYEENEQTFENKLLMILKLFERAWGELGGVKGVCEFSSGKDLKEAIEDFEQRILMMKHSKRAVSYLNLAFVLDQIRILLVEITSRIQKYHAEGWQRIQ